MKNNGPKYFFSGGIIAIAGLAGFLAMQPEDIELKSFAQCIEQSGATFYGAFWCPHCVAQKEAFGDAEKYLPYVECSTPDGQRQTEACAEAEIKSYPTWEFGDNTRVSGDQTLEQLAEKTSCSLPQA